MRVPISIAPIIMLSQKTDDTGRSSISPFCINAAANPGSLTTPANAMKTTIIAMRPKSEGESSLARIIVITNYSPIFTTLEQAFQAIPDMTLSFNDMGELTTYMLFHRI